jgi:hypothetical protein
VARRTALWTATHDRDANKTFLLTEMSADKAERWAIRMILSLTNANVEVPEGALTSGMSGMAAVLAQGVRGLAGLKYASISDLLDEMMECVQFQPAPNLPPQPLWKGENCQIEEVRTRLELRMEVLSLHVNFSLAALVSNTRKTSAPTTDAA